MEERLIQIIKAALYYKASDIHFSLFHQESKVIIEMRINKQMYTIKSKKEDIKLFRYLMYKANLDLSDSFLPQSGRFEMDIDNKNISLRFSTVNSYYLTSGVLRILDNHPLLHIADLSYDHKTITYLQNITNHANGLFVFSGATGSGKTTTLYTILNEVKKKKIFTLEDPIEVFNENYVQIQINPSRKLSYQDGIKQLMRHDPDIVMIGEIRDEEAAINTVRCALTGHLVLTSIHASSCIQTINRLLELGVKTYDLKEVLKGISNQRLININNKIYGKYEIIQEEEIKKYLQEIK